MPLQGPSFMAHQGQQRPDVLARLLTSAHGNRPQLRVGATVFVPSYLPTTTADILGAFRPVAAYVLADPQTYKLEGPGSRGRAAHAIPYLRGPSPEQNVDQFVTDVLASQVSAGCTVLISPWLTHGIGAGQQNLRTTRAFADAAASHALVQGRTLLVGVGVTADVLANGATRADFLDEIVDWPERAVYLRVRVTPPTSFAQVADDDLLGGLRDVVEALRDNDRDVLLPQSGLMGWLMMPRGAVSFGAGISASLQRHVPPRDGGGGAEPLPWYFLQQFLGFVLRGEVAQIARTAGYQRCPCPFCPNLTLAGAGPWNRDEAGLHFLWWCGLLAQEQRQAQNRLRAVRQRIDAARAFARSVQATRVVLDPRSIPTHLEAWSRVVV